MEEDKALRVSPRARTFVFLGAFILGGFLAAAAQPPEPFEGVDASPASGASPAAGSAPAAQTTVAAPDESQEIQIVAKHKSWDPTNKHFKATGDVEVHYKNLVLFADSIDLETETKDVLAVGHVVLQTPNEVTTAERLSFNLESALGRMDKAVGLAQPSLFFEAGVLERRQSGTYHFEKASFTTCTQPSPRWKFSCARANYKKDDYMEMWGMVLSVKGIPVFYFPYFRYPLKDRSTGLLQPNVGYTKTKGWKYSQDFYLVLARNMDATLNLLTYSSLGVGAGLEYRYIFSDGTGGELRLFNFSFKKNADGVKPPQAYIIRVKHNQTLPLGFQFVADVDIQSSYDFLREFDNSLSRATVSNRRSQAYLSNSFSGFNLTARASRFETYFAGSNNSVVTQYLPQITLSSFKIKLFSPLYVSFSSSFSRWEYGWQTEFDNGSQKRLQSLSFSPAVSLPFSSIPWLTVTSSLAGNFFYYWQSLASASNQNTIVDQPFFSNNFVLALELRGPVLYRVFNNAAGSPAVKHIIEPTFNYRYDSPTLNADRIVTAAGFFRYHQISYGLANHVLVKQGKMSREMLTLSLSQTYYLAPETGPLSPYRYNGRIPEFSDITGFVRFFPAAQYSLDFSSSYNPYHRAFSSIRLGARAGNPNDDLFLNVNWFKSLSVWRNEEYWNRHQINVFGGLKLPRLNLDILGEADYNVMDKSLLYAGLTFVYHYQCVNIQGYVRLFNYREKRDVEYSVSLGLGGISYSSDFLGGLGF